MFKKLFEDFKAFAFKGNVIDMAVGVVIGSAFTAIVNSLVNDIITPLLGLIPGGKNFENLFWVLKAGESGMKEYTTTELAAADGAVILTYGAFIQAIINFFLVAIAIFAVVKLIKAADVKAKKQAEADAKAKAEAEAAAKALIKVCPYCLTEIHVNATRCPHCTSEQPKA